MTGKNDIAKSIKSALASCLGHSGLGTYMGHIDEVNSRFVKGWAADIASAKPVSVSVYLNDRFYENCIADEFREDLNFLHPDRNGKAGFFLPIDIWKHNIKESYVSVQIGKFTLPEVRFFVSKSPSPRVFFMHIPKTGGSTVNAVAEKSFRRSITHLEGASAWMNSEYLQGYEFSSGHIRIGDFHKYHDPNNFKTLSMVREPEDQFISHVSWLVSYNTPIRSHELQTIHPDIQKYVKKFKYIDLKDRDGLLAHLRVAPEGLLENVQSRFFLTDVDNIKLSHQHLSKISDGVSRVDAIGITERFGESMELFSKVSGKKFFYNDEHENIGVSAIAQSIRMTLGSDIEEFIWCDRFIYELAKSKILKIS